MRLGRSALLWAGAVPHTFWSALLARPPTQVRRAQQHGVSGHELRVVVANWDATLRTSWSEREQVESSSFAEDYKDHFLLGGPAPSPDWSVAAENSLLKTLTTEQMQVSVPPGGGVWRKGRGRRRSTATSSPCWCTHQAATLSTQKLAAASHNQPRQRRGRPGG